jgi:hypothetical protein
MEGRCEFHECLSHQGVACTTLDFHALTEAQRRVLVRVLRDELSPTTDRQRLLGFARRWLYEHRLLVPRERDLRVMIHKAVRSHKAALARSIHGTRQRVFFLRDLKRYHFIAPKVASSLV